MYEPELGQLAYGNPWSEYPVPGEAERLLGGLLDEVALLDGDDTPRGEQFDTCYLHNAPNIPGLALRPYWWGDDDDEAALPNIAFDGIEIRFYKYFGRGMTCNVRLSAREWSEWGDRVRAAIRSASFPTE